ncbi:MAG: twin-arginine translocase TatA/TatE family subunit [Coriobacteriales bacterium]|nr:twin-arginine translocase TatA/TatE family subunit [Coriobacteriales bacterium]
MFGIGETELVIIVVFAFLLFGPDKLPGMGRTLGRVLRQFREASDGFTEVVQTNIMDPASEELEKSPKQRKREAAALNGDDGEPTEASEVPEEPQPRRETFAERKARLTAERKAAAEAEAARAAEAESDDAAPQVVAGDELKDEPVRTTAADLYALGSQRSSRAQAKEAASQGEDDPSGEEGEQA